MIDKRTKLTEEQFSAFQVEAEYWLDRLHLRNWEVYYGRIPEDEEGEGFADCRVDNSGRVACLRLALSYHSIGKLRFPRVIHEASFHEVCELMLGDLRTMSQFNNQETNKVVHEIIRRLEHSVFDPDWVRRQTQGNKENEEQRQERHC